MPEQLIALSNAVMTSHKQRLTYDTDPAVSFWRCSFGDARLFIRRVWAALNRQVIVLTPHLNWIKHTSGQVWACMSLSLHSWLQCWYALSRGATRSAV